MIEFLDIKVNKTKPVATDIFFTFKDTEIDKEKFMFLKDRLNQYMFELDSNYSMESETEYNEDLKIMLMGIDIIIPDRLISKDFKEIVEFFASQITGFRKFYEEQEELFTQLNH